MNLFVILSSCLILTSGFSSAARADDATVVDVTTQSATTAPATTIPPTETADRKSGQVDAADRKSGQVDAADRKSGQVDAADRKSGQTNSADFKNAPADLSTQGHQGIGLGFMTGNATDDTKGAVPQTLQFEYYNVGTHPAEGGRGYGLNQYKLEFSGVSQGMPQMALEMRGMSGWQIIRAGKDHPVMFHLGVEPLNFESQITTNIVSDARNTAARIAEGLASQNGVAGQPQAQQGISQIGNPDAAVMRKQYLYYVPSISAGIDIRKAGCRFLALVRGGAGGGGQLRTDGYSYGVAPAYGAGVYVNCAQLSVSGEWTRIAQSDAPMDLLNSDVMYTPFKKIPLAVGAELGSTVTNSQDPKSVPVALPGYGVKGASVETHAGGMVRLVF